MRDPQCLGVDPRVEPASVQPTAVDPALVGTHHGVPNVGAGYFFDDVLEYRVWLDLPDGERYHAFAQWERADAYSQATPLASKPFALVRQLEYVNEPAPGEFEHVREVRVTEWRAEWLDGTKRGPTSIADFLAARRTERPSAGSGR